MTDREKYKKIGIDLTFDWSDGENAADYFPNAIADAIERAVAEAVTKQADEGARALLDQQRILIEDFTGGEASLVEQIAKLKSELERVTGERDKANTRWISAVGRLSMRKEECDTLKAQLEEAIEWIKKLRDSTYWPNNVYIDTEIFLQKVSGQWRERLEDVAKVCEGQVKRAVEAEAEIDRLKAELESERKGWPHEQPFTDLPMARQIVLLNRQVTVLNNKLRNLLARIHRDGGHYTDKHGLDKSVADADAKVVEDRAQLEEACGVLKPLGPSLDGDYSHRTPLLLVSWNGRLMEVGITVGHCRAARAFLQKVRPQ